MNRFLLSLALALIAGWHAFADDASEAPPAGKTAEAPQNAPWLLDFAAAQREALANRRPLLARFGGEACPWCKRLEEEISNPQVQAELKKWTLVYIDVDKAPAEARRWGVGPIPSLRVFNSTGRQIHHSDGYRDAADLAKWLDAMFAVVSEAPDAALLGSDEPNLTETLRLVRAFGNRDPLVREGAVRRLAPFPAMAREHVIHALREGSLASRLTALELLTQWKAPVEQIDPWQPESLTDARLAALEKWSQTELDLNFLAKEHEVLPAEQQTILKDDLQKLLAASDAEAAVIRERIARLGPAALPVVVEQLAAAAADRDRERLLALRYRLAATGDLALRWPAGLERLASSDVNARHAAAEELAKMENPQLQPLFLELFSDPDPLVREISLRALRRMGGPSATAALVKLLSDPDANVRAAVLKLLTEEASEEMLEAVGKYAIQEQDADLVVHAVRYLREVKSTGSLKYLTQLLSHDAWQVRAEAAEGVGKKLNGDRFSFSDNRPDPAVVDQLHPLLHDAEPFVISRAIEALPNHLTKKDIDALLKVCEDQPDISPAVVQKLISDHESRDAILPRLQPFLTHSQASVRAAVVGVFSDFRDEAMEKNIRNALDDEEVAVRKAALEALHSALESVLRQLQANETASSRPLPVAPSSFDLAGTLGKLVQGIKSPAKADDPATEPKPEPEPQQVNPADRGLLEIYAGKHRPAWTKNLIPRLEELLKSASPEERAAAAVILVPLGKPDIALPVLQEAAPANAVAFRQSMAALPWLLQAQRIQFFKFLREKASGDELGQLLWGLDETISGPLLPEIWLLFNHPKAPPEIGRNSTYVLRKAYFGSRYWDKTERTESEVKRAAEDLNKQVAEGTTLKRLVALNLLLDVSPSDAQPVVERWLTDKDQPEALRRDAFNLYLLTLPAGAREEKAIATLEEPDADRLRVALNYLAYGGSALTALPATGFHLDLNSDDLATATATSITSGSSEFRPIIPQAPKRLTAEQVRPLLSHSDPQIVAMSGYFLALLNDPAGLPALLHYWSATEVSPELDRLVYRAIAVGDDAAQLRVLRTIYARLPENYRGDFYWTIRIMSGPDLLRFRDEIRDEVGMETLRRTYYRSP